VSAPVLAVPVPEVSYDAVGAGVAALEKPLTVSVAGVARDGHLLGPADLARFGVAVVRRARPGAGPEAWDAEHLRWVPDPGTGLPAAAHTPFAHRADQPSPWQALVVAAGGKDADGAPQYAKAVGGFPSYRFRGAFADRDGRTGTSSLSAPVAFAGVADRNLVVLGAGEDEEPASATQARVVLKSPTLQPIGQLVVQRAGAGAAVTLSNSAGATVLLHPDGSIELRPAAGRQVVVTSDLEIERLRYRPASGGSKQTLP
jgi:hypothetical protein